MSSSHSRSLTRIVTLGQRLNERSTFGTMDDAYEAAHHELATHNYQNAWGLLTEVLGQDLFIRWRAMPNHASATNSDRLALLHKLYNSKQLDQWEFRLFKAALEHPKVYTLRKCDLLAALVKVFAYHNPGPTVEPKPAPPEADRDARQVEQWIPVPTAEPEPAVAPEPTATLWGVPVNAVESSTACEDSETPVEVEAAVETAPRPRRVEPRYLPTEEEIEAECERMREERFPAIQQGDDEVFERPHWKAHHLAMELAGLC
jgi:hypothetical protein